MIEINLLPEEYRPAGSTPPRTLGLLVAAAVLSTSSLAGMAYVYFDVYAGSESQLQIAQDQLSSLTPQQTYAQSLEKEKSDYQKRHSTMNEIASSRVLWSKKLDRLCAVVNQDVQTSRHQVWLDQLDMDTGATRQGGMKFKGYSAGGLVINVSNFHEDLQRDASFAEGFVEFSPPTTRRAETEVEYQPAEKWDFNFDAKMPEKTKKKGRRR